MPFCFPLDSHDYFLALDKVEPFFDAGHARIEAIEAERLLGERDMNLREPCFETAKAALDLANIAFHAIELPTHMT
jgi:hypothetical protein